MNIAQMDQMKEAAKDLAKIAGDHYKALLNEGFGEYQALQLTMAFQTALITRGD